MNIPVYDRIKKIVTKEIVYGSLFLRALYPKNPLAQKIVWPLSQLICRLPWASALYGALQMRKSSAKKVPPFIKRYDVDSTEFKKTTFESFNDFFVRHLKKEARPIKNGIIAPADGRYRFIQKIDGKARFYAKGQRLDLKKLVGSEELSQRFEGGSMVIARLAPPDYHRFHYPVDGEAKAPRRAFGPLFSVNPRSLRQNLSHLTENKRLITQISGAFGEMLFIEIGATFVGSIHQTHTLPGPVTKGFEKGYFSFGASAVILLFEKDKIVFEKDLLEAPEGLEVRCLMGQTIASLNET